MDVTVGISLVGAAIAAVGAPGVTFWVMKRMTSSFMQTQIEGCKKCRSEIDSRITEVVNAESKIIERQMSLREIEIPVIRETYSRKVDLEKTAAEMKVDLCRSTAEIKQEIKIVGAGMKSDMKDLCDKVSADIRRVQDRVDHFHSRREPNV